MDRREWKTGSDEHIFLLQYLLQFFTAFPFWFSSQMGFVPPSRPISVLRTHLLSMLWDCSSELGGFAPLSQPLSINPFFAVLQKYVYANLCWSINQPGMESVLHVSLGFPELRERKSCLWSDAWRNHLSRGSIFKQLNAPPTTPTIHLNSNASALETFNHNPSCSVLKNTDSQDQPWDNVLDRSIIDRLMHAPK